jgi:hypothetical protein
MIHTTHNCPYKFEITNTKELIYPPTRNRHGKTRSPHDIKTVFWVKTNMVTVPTLMTSDLHSYGETVFDGPRLLKSW